MDHRELVQAAVEGGQSRHGRHYDLGLGPRPIFDLEAIDALERHDIAGDERQATRPCLSGDEHIIGAYRSALPREHGPDLAGRAIVCERGILQEARKISTRTC